jgi:hypothetical protein
MRAFARLSAFRLCRWINSHYVPVLDLRQTAVHLFMDFLKNSCALAGKVG